MSKRPSGAWWRLLIYESHPTIDPSGVVPLGPIIDFVMPACGSADVSEHGPIQRDQRYDSITIRLHWLTVALVAILWILGQVTGWLPRGPFRLGVWSTHVVLGLTLAMVLATRILWRAGFGSALPPADTGVLQWLAKGTHYALYVLLVTVIILGIANASYMGFELYGVLTMPRFGNGDPATERGINSLHEWAANLVVLVTLFHAAAALGHQYIWRDHLLQRMRPRL